MNPQAQYTVLHLSEEVLTLKTKLAKLQGDLVVAVTKKVKHTENQEIYEIP